MADRSNPALSGPLPFFAFTVLGDDYVAAYSGPVPIVADTAFSDDWASAFSGPIAIVADTPFSDDWQSAYSGPLSITVFGPHNDDWAAAHSGPVHLARTVEIIRIADGQAKTDNVVTPPYNFTVTTVNDIPAGTHFHADIEHFHTPNFPGSGLPYATTVIDVDGPILAGAVLGTITVNADGSVSFA